MKFRKGNIVIESDIENNFNLFQRYGFEPVIEPVKEVAEAQKVETQEAEAADDLDELKAKAKELGIRNSHSMGKAKLLERIAEAEQNKGA